MNLNNKKHIRLFFENIIIIIVLLVLIKLSFEGEPLLELYLGRILVAIMLINEFIANVRALRNKPFIAIEGDYLIIYNNFHSRRLLIADTRFRFQKIMLRNYLVFNCNTRLSMLRCAFISDDLEMQLRKAFVQSKYGEVALENMKKALDY